MLHEAGESQFDEFYAELKRTEREDAVLTSKDQIARLLRPGSTYFNLNPYDVLLVAEDESIEEIRKRFRRLSILIHPDKNPDDRENSEKAFDILKKALETLENPNQRARIRLIYEEGKARTDKAIAEKRRLMKKANKENGGGPKLMLEDDPQYYQKCVWVNTIRVFAERERKRRMMAEREMEDKKRAHAEAEQLKEKQKQDMEWQKNYEESRDERVNSWKNFKSKKGKKGGFRPPKHKSESRT